MVSAKTDTLIPPLAVATFGMNDVDEPRDTDAEVFRMDTADGHVTVEVEASATDHDHATQLVDDVIAATVDTVRGTFDE